MRVFTFEEGKFNFDLVNLTDHSIFISTIRHDNIAYEIEPSGIVARVKKLEIEPSFQIKSLNGLGHNFRVSSIQHGRVINLPPSKEHTFYIVSSLCAQAIARQFPTRGDILSPDARHLRKRPENELPVVFRLLQHKP